MYELTSSALGAKIQPNPSHSTYVFELFFLVRSATNQEIGYDLSRLAGLFASRANDSSYALCSGSLPVKSTFLFGDKKSLDYKYDDV